MFADLLGDAEAEEYARLANEAAARASQRDATDGNGDYA